MSKLKEWILKWFHGSNKPVVAEVVIKATAAGLKEATREVVRLDSTYTRDSALDAILNEYKK